MFIFCSTVGTYTAHVFLCLSFAHTSSQLVYQPRVGEKVVVNQSQLSCSLNQKCLNDSFEKGRIEGGKRLGVKEEE